jgi:hypothetical protein
MEARCLGPASSSAAEAERGRPTRHNWGPALAEIGLIFAVFALHAALPVPDHNEAHYLTKARHFWQPEWLAGDEFLRSADAHYAFYLTAGWLAAVLPLSAAAWVGRLATWGLLAWSWRRLSFAVAPRWGYGALSAALFVAISTRFHMASEWVIGGFEAKGLAYVLVLVALEALVRNRWNLALALTGGAALLHPLVGGWTAVAIGFAWLSTRSDRPPLARVMPGVALAAAIALPSVWWALRVNAGTAPDVLAEAHAIYVFERLPHHLVPQQFKAGLVARHVALLAGWVALCAATSYDAGQRRLRWAVNGAIAISACGVAIGLATSFDPPLAARLLQFFWFRLADALVPLGTALLGAAAIYRLSRSRPAAARLWLGAAVTLAALHLGGDALRLVLLTVPRGDEMVTDYGAWRDACAWIAANTPPDARVLTPRTAQTFKWYAGRAEVVTWKDVPQDAEGIARWWQRMRAIHWVEARDPHSGGLTDWWRPTLSELPPDELRRLGAAFDAQYLLTEARPVVGLPAVYRNRGYAVYALGPYGPGRDQPGRVGATPSRRRAGPTW